MAPEVQVRKELSGLRGQPETGVLLSRVSSSVRHYAAAVFSLSAGELTAAEFCRAVAGNEAVGVVVHGLVPAVLQHIHPHFLQRPSHALAEELRKNGALGGKLIGAGGGGFLMFYTEDKTRLRRVMRDAGLREVRVRFDFAGTTVLANS